MVLSGCIDGGRLSVQSWMRSCDNNLPKFNWSRPVKSQSTRVTHAFNLFLTLTCRQARNSKLFSAVSVPWYKQRNPQGVHHLAHLV